MYIRALVLENKLTYDSYYGSHSNFKPKQVDTVSLTILLLRSCKRSKTRIGISDSRTKESHDRLRSIIETLPVAEVYFVTDSRLLPIMSSTEQSTLLVFSQNCARTVRGPLRREKGFLQI